MTLKIYDDGHCKVYELDQPDPNAGGGTHEFLVCWGDVPEPEEGSRLVEGDAGSFRWMDGEGWPRVSFEGFLVTFQHGPIKEVGTNGGTNEALMAICEQRLKRFQAGQFACETNAAALTCATHAREHLEARTRDRKARGVEGRNEK